MVVAAVKSPVYKLYLWYFMFQENRELFFYKPQTPEPDSFIDGGKAVAAGIRATSAAFIIDDPL